MNECLENISGCAHNCINTFGGFKCSCNQGYLLGKDLKSCIGKFMGERTFLSTVVDLLPVPMNFALRSENAQLSLLYTFNSSE
jgi:hypothetical protein